MRTRERTTARILAWSVAVLLAGYARMAAAGEIKTPSDHLLSGFPLMGAHVRVPCEQCHSEGVFEGTPTRCTWCHTQGGPVAASVKRTNHIPTTMECDVCHTDRSWHIGRLDHFLVSQPCVTCHNNATARGKPADHIPAPTTCGDCHSTERWTPTLFGGMTVERRGRGASGTRRHK
jgi:hypothetical protein